MDQRAAAEQSLTVVERLFPLIVSGEKTSTIRWCETWIVPGPLTFYCDADATQAIEVVVSRATTMPLYDAASFVGRADEWSDSRMLCGMREHYPDIALSSIVQVVEFNCLLAEDLAKRSKAGLLKCL